MISLVIPSIRENYFQQFLSAWDENGDWDNIILIEDNPERTFRYKSRWPINHYSWKEIEEILGVKSWIFSKRDSAIRSFGFYMAHKLGADYVLTLDDDCYPNGDFNICDSHLEKMIHNQWTTSVPDKRTRGLPYEELGTIICPINMGFWSNVPDLDAIQSFQDLKSARGGFLPPNGNRIIPNGQYFPMCGMNLFFSAKIAPLMYFPLMGQGQKYARFDDIWCGVIAKKIMDHLNLNFSVGEPHIFHSRASNLYINLIKEAPGIQMNEYLWRHIEGIKLTETSLINCVYELGDKLSKAELADIDIEYIKTLGSALKIWSSLFNT